MSSPDPFGGSHHRDPRVKSEDDIVENSKIPKANSKISKPSAIPRLDRGISSLRILEFPVPAVAAVKIKGAALASSVPAAVRR